MTAILQTKNEDIEKMLIASTHNGTKNCEVLVEPYVWRTRTDDGTNIINLEKTWEKLQLAARIIAAIENPQDIIAFSKREYGHRAVLKFAEYTGARCEAGRWTPGQLTNQICQKYSEPRLLIVNDPLVDCNVSRLTHDRILENMH
uniref:40S ribosomal protein SA n=1 Tax=Rhodosorus marinus TaxID=101924 RepID=A0A7S2ZZT7_9RHOD|mmetsp:Transcript_39316/g.155964  ORF Transcript_39316/g.155964 Transcript_39316/m.155964 type:complete len:145 (+) Transcript_39316:219-653(+)